MSTLTDTKHLIDRLQDIRSESERKHGPFMVFALLKPIGHLRFDLIVSASWCDEDFTPIVRELTSVLAEKLTWTELIMWDVGAVIVAQTSSEIAKSIVRNYPTQGEAKPIRNEEFGNLEVSEGWILKAG